MLFFVRGAALSPYCGLHPIEVLPYLVTGAALSFSLVAAMPLPGGCSSLWCHHTHRRAAKPCHRCSSLLLVTTISLEMLLSLTVVLPSFFCHLFCHLFPYCHLPFCQRLLHITVNSRPPPRPRLQRGGGCRETRENAILGFWRVKWGKYGG